MMNCNWKTGHTLYVERVKSTFRSGVNWLDAGGGHQIFHDSYDGEKELVEQSNLVVVCDYDHESLKKHFSCATRLRCDLNRIPLRSDFFDFITCGMVVEHLSDPSSSIRELARLLKPGGILMIHTVNLHGYATQLARISKIIPHRLRRQMISCLTRREEDDIFPTFYRMNTKHLMNKTMHNAGLEVQAIEFLPSSLLFSSIPLVRSLESMWARLLLGFPAMTPLLNQLLVVAGKPAVN
jgi:ubiquinone/menaquinone biosynthesis C-methylase UbiE